MDLQLPRVRLSPGIPSLFITNFLAYLEINPEIQLTIIDVDSTVGGVWSKSRVYAGLTCDAPVPTFEFSDLHMNEEFNLPKWSDLPGATMHEYLERYAKKFDILSRCMFNTEVISIERGGKGWKLFTKISGSRRRRGWELLPAISLLWQRDSVRNPTFQLSLPLLLKG